MKSIERNRLTKLIGKEVPNRDYMGLLDNQVVIQSGTLSQVKSLLRKKKGSKLIIEHYTLYDIVESYAITYRMEDDD